MSTHKRPEKQHPGTPLGRHIHHFHGGMKLRHHKQMSVNQPSTAPPLPPVLIMPLRQHAGPPAEPVVSAGDHVVRGQLLAEAVSASSVAVHAPASGEIMGIEAHAVPNASGQPERCIKLATVDDTDSMLLDPLKNSQLTAELILERISEAGIAGLGGAVFPTHQKMGKGAVNHAIHTVLLNGAECEPYISCDEMLMREQPLKIIRGGLLMARAVGAGSVIIGIEDQMGVVAGCLQQALENIENNQIHIRVRQVQTIYPEGGERQMVQVLTGEEVPADGYPLDMGILVQNVATAAAVADAVDDGLPLIQRYVTITGPGVRQPQNFRALLGTPVEHLVTAAGGYQGDPQRMVMGGPISGIAMQTDAMPVTKASNCFLFLNAENLAHLQAPMPCINCGECVRVCPAQLMPQTLYKNISAGDFEAAADLSLDACIKCGCCDLACPSHIPLVDYFRYGLDELARLAQENRLADHARRRFEARQGRLERQQSEREARRKARAERLDDRSAAQAELQAAIARGRAKQARQDADDPAAEEPES